MGNKVLVERREQQRKRAVDMIEIERNEKRKTTTDRHYELDWDTKGTKRTKRVQNQTELGDKNEGEKAGITKRKMSRQNLSHQSEVRKNRKVRKAVAIVVKAESGRKPGRIVITAKITSEKCPLVREFMSLT